MAGPSARLSPGSLTAGAAGLSASVATGSFGISAIAAGDGAGGLSAACARSRCSGVGVHRHRKSEPTMSLVTPSVRMSVHTPHAEQDRRNDRRAAGSAGEATAHSGRSHQGDAHEGDRPYVEQPPHSAPGNRLVDEARRRGERDNHEHGDAQALGPGRAAERKATTRE